MKNNSTSLACMENLRFKNDCIASAGIHLNHFESDEFQEQLKCRNLASSTRIVPEIFPEIAKAVEDVREKLIPGHNVDAYIRNSSDFQANCFPGRDRSISISLTSGLVRLSSINELRFVIGHELGHHLLGHHAYPQPEQAANQAEKLNILALRRAAEISADRVGFVAVDNKESAYRAILKIATGLPDEFVRFDLSAYLKQARELIALGGSEYGLLSSHPTCTTRMRALLWFEMSESYNSWCDHQGESAVSCAMLDRRVEKDMASVGGFRLAKINKKEAAIAMQWGVLSLFISDGRLSKDEQNLMKQTFGEETAGNLMCYLREHGVAGVTTKFEQSLRTIRFMTKEIKEALFLDLESFAKQAGGELEVRKQVLQKTLSTMEFDCSIKLS